MASRRDQERKEFQRLYRDVQSKSSKGTEGSLKKLRGKGREVSRDYLASMIIGAGGTPLARLAGARLSRALHNRDIRKAIARTKKPSIRRALRSKIETGPAVGPSYSVGKHKGKPLMTTGDVVGHGVYGAVLGSLVQMLRDRFSGSAGAGDFR